MSQAPRKESARASILSSAMQIIAKGGERAATFRAVAAAAGVSHSLLQHHFGTKQGLVAAVEGMVAERFSAALATTTTDAQMASNEIAAGLSELIAGDAQLRSYLRRALLEATPAGQALFVRIADLVVRQTRAAWRSEDPAERFPTRMARRGGRRGQPCRRDLRADTRSNAWGKAVRPRRRSVANRGQSTLPRGGPKGVRPLEGPAPETRSNSRLRLGYIVCQTPMCRAFAIQRKSCFTRQRTISRRG